MAQESIQIADKPTLDQVKEIVENFKFMNIIECSFDSDSMAADPIQLPDIPYEFHSGSGGVLSGIGTVISDTEPSDTNCLWLDTSDSNNIKFYDTTIKSWKKTNGDVTLSVNEGILTANYDNSQST